MRTLNIEHGTSNIQEKAKPILLHFNVRCSTFDVACSHLCVLLFLLISKVATAQTTAPATQPTASSLEVHEWSVFVIDASTGQLNPDGVVTATLPAFITDHRFGSASTPPAPAQNNRFGMMVINGMVVQNNQNSAPARSLTDVDLDLPSPVGVIRLIGSADSKVDVSITAMGGTFAGSWPKAEDRAHQLLWRDITLSDQPAMPPPVTGPDNWFSALREVQSDYVNIEHVGSEKFLTYDLQMPYPSPIKVNESNDFSVEISNIGKFPLHDVTLYQGDGKNPWRSVSFGDLAVSEHPQPADQIFPQTSRLGVSLDDVAGNRGLANSFGYQSAVGVIVKQILPDKCLQGNLQDGDIITAVDGKKTDDLKSLNDLVDVAAAGTSVKLSVFRNKAMTDIGVSLLGQPIALPTTEPIAATPDPTQGKHQLTIGPTTQPSDLADEWKPSIIKAGVDPGDADVITHVIKDYAFDAHRLTAVYRMDDGEFDRLLPIEVVPQPAKIMRYGLVIVVNADPSKGTVADDLIAQLGDNDWSKRDAAYHALVTLGPAASPKLTAASKSSDLEVAWRAERLLALLPGGK